MLWKIHPEILKQGRPEFYIDVKGRPEFYIDVEPWNRVCGFTLIIIKFGKQDWEGVFSTL